MMDNEIYLTDKDRNRVNWEVDGKTYHIYINKTYHPNFLTIEGTDGVVVVPVASNMVRIGKRS